MNFTPTDLAPVLGDDFKLIGADYSGSLNKGKYNSIFRYYEGKHGQRFEINELYLNPENNYSLNVYIESINFNLLGHPATLQHLQNSQVTNDLKSNSKSVGGQDIFDLDFNVGRRVFSLSSEGISYPDFLAISSNIVRLVEHNE